LCAAEALAFEGVGFAFGGRQPVLEGVDVQVPAGGLCAIVGVSGCGKSTLLRLAAGLLQPTAGRIRGAGDRRAFVFQSPTLLPWRTVAANVRLPLEVLGDLEGAGPRVAAALARVGLSEVATALPRTLSGGMQMRVSLARALVTRPRLLLLDEPFSSLDALTRRRLQEEFLSLRRDLGITTVLVTHDVDEAAWLSDQVVVLGGRPATVQAELTVDLPRPRTRELLHDPALGRISRAIEEAL